MEIMVFDDKWDDIVDTPDIDGIETDGFTIRSGNKVLKLKVVETEIIEDVDSIKQELQEKFDKEIVNIKESFDTYKKSMKDGFDTYRDEIEEKKRELERRLSEISVLPDIREKHLNAGLSVYNDRNGKLIWSYKCVYQPKFINDKRIDPSFAKRLMGPITLQIKTSNGKVTSVLVNKIIGNSKFRHYHSLSSSEDCWGDYNFQGEVIKTPDEMVDFAKKTLSVLEIINEFSLGTTNPSGLSRFNTLKKHVITETDVLEPNTTRHSSRDVRAGYDETVNDESSGWST